MNLELKQKIVAASLEYIEANKLSNKEFAQMADINAGYLSLMLRGTFITNANGKDVEIADKYFTKIAETIRFKFDTAVWQTVLTPQFKQIIFELAAAKESGDTRTIIGNTGCGKTHAVDVFVSKNPQYTYRATVSRMHSLNDIINELLAVMGLSETGSKASRMKRIAEFVKEIKRNGGNPVIVIDEAENMKTPIFGLFKGIYDSVKGFCPIVMIGTEELTDKMERMKKRAKDGMPQFYRRFKAGIRFVVQVDKRYPDFMEKYVEDRGLRNLLLELCDNYGELNDYLEPVMKEAQRLGEPLTENLFRRFHNLPKR